MVLLCVVRFVEDQEIDLVDGDKCMHETLIQNLCCAANDHILLEMLFPDASMPKIATHISTEPFDLLVQIVL